MSYNNNWTKELKEAYLEEKKAIQVVKAGAKVAKEVGKKVVKALGTKGGSGEAMHLGRGGMYDHVEHQGNDLQEQIALNEHLLSLIEALCEELGIDVEELLEQVNVEDQPHGTVVKSSLGWRAKRRKKARYDDGGGEDEHEHFDSREDANKWAADGMSEPKFKAFVPKR